MKKLIISLIFLSNFAPNHAMKNNSNLNTRTSDIESNNNGYVSLQDQDLSEENEDDIDDLSTNAQKKQKEVITVYQQNGGMVLPGKWVVIKDKHENIKIRVAKAAWKQYCTPKAFKNCACGSLAIFLMISLYKLAMMAETLTSQDSISQ